MNLILRPTTAPLAKLKRSTSLQAWQPRRSLDLPLRELCQLDQTQTRAVLKALEEIHPLKVTSYGRASQLQSTVTWRHARLSAQKGLADCGPVEMTFRFDAWAKAIVNLNPQDAQPGLYIYENTGALIASMLPRDPQALPELRDLLSQYRTAPSKTKHSFCSSPGPLRRPGPSRQGYGPRTHQDSRAFTIAQRYALGRGEHLSLRSPQCCTRINTSELEALFRTIYEYDLELGLLHGPSSFWQLHEAIVRPTLTGEQRLALCGARCRLEVELPRTCESWLVRAQHQGEFIYAVLFYDHTLKLDAAAILPRSTMACSTSDWRSLVEVVGKASKMPSYESSKVRAG